jgi:hypothetical protein
MLVILSQKFYNIHSLMLIFLSLLHVGDSFIVFSFVGKTVMKTFSLLCGSLCLVKAQDSVLC